MDTTRAALLRDVLEGTGWSERSRALARSLRVSTRNAAGLLLVGTPDYEPWHLAAHLDREAWLGGIPELCPTLVRHAVPPGAPAHLSVGLERIAASGRGETIFVVAPEPAPEGLLQRVSDARRVGATILAIDGGDADLRGLAHDGITVPPAAAPAPRRTGHSVAHLLDQGVSIDLVQHLVSLSAGESPAGGPYRRPRLRDRLARALDAISGPRPGG